MAQPFTILTVCTANMCRSALAEAAASAEPLVRAPWHWWPIDDRTLNILIFVPIGFAVMLVGRPRVRVLLVVGAVLLPWFVESSQFAVTWLSRDPQWQDVADNTVGVPIGLALGWLVNRSRDHGDGAVQGRHGRPSNSPQV